MMVRTATLEDCQVLGVIHTRSWQAAYRGQIPDQFLDSLRPETSSAMWKDLLPRPEQRTFVSESDGTMVGFCNLMPSRDEEADRSRTGEITSMYVLADRWRQGHGRALCAAAIDCARERGFQEIILWVLKGNDRARRFYEGIGFQLDGGEKQVPHRSGVTLDEIRYRLALRSERTLPPLHLRP